MSATIALPRLLRVGGGASAELGGVLQSLGLSKPLLVSDGFLRDHGHVERLQHVLSSSSITRTRVFCDTVPDPTVRSIAAGIAFLKQAEHDCVIGVGGGSVLDSAKTIAVAGYHGGPISKYRVPHQQDHAGLPIIAIPTTAGTGSEATRFTVITDEATNEKMLCAGLAYLPVAALVDYELTLTMPKRLTADTGIDALTHAIEAYVSRRANPFADGMALQAMRAIAPNLRTVFREPDHRKAREAMMIGATQAGIAFSNSSVALVHGMSRPIGAHFHVSHGLSNAMLLPAVTEFSAPAAPLRYADCARAMGIATMDQQTDVALARLLAELRSINVDLEVPSPQDYGISQVIWEKLLDSMAEQALASGSPGNNPAVPTADQIKSLYKLAYS
jgi:alcohol dehydrogenase class IV